MYSFTKRAHSNGNVRQMAKNRQTPRFSKNKAPSCLILSGWAKLPFLMVSRSHQPSKHLAPVSALYLSGSALSIISNAKPSLSASFRLLEKGSCEGLSASVTSVINSLLPSPSPSNTRSRASPQLAPLMLFSVSGYHRRAVGREDLWLTSADRLRAPSVH